MLLKWNQPISKSCDLTLRRELSTAGSGGVLPEEVWGGVEECQGGDRSGQQHGGGTGGEGGGECGVRREGGDGGADDRGLWAAAEGVPQDEVQPTQLYLVGQLL